MFCSECGKQVQDNAKFCGECGARTAANINEDKADSTTFSFANGRLEIIEQADVVNAKNNSSKKDMGTAIILTVLLGPVGLFYANVMTAFLLLGVFLLGYLKYQSGYSFEALEDFATLSIVLWLISIVLAVIFTSKNK